MWNHRHTFFLFRKKKLSKNFRWLEKARRKQGSFDHSINVRKFWKLNWNTRQSVIKGKRGLIWIFQSFVWWSNLFCRFLLRFNDKLTIVKFRRISFPNVSFFSLYHWKSMRCIFWGIVVQVFVQELMIPGFLSLT